MKRPSRKPCGLFAALLLPALGGLSLPGCGEPPAGDRVVAVHPIPDSLSVDPEEAILIRREPGERPHGALAEFASRLDGRSTTAVIGVEDGEEPYLFGRVVDALVLDDGSIAVADQQPTLVRVFGPEGRYRYSIGGPGDGPGEFSFPVALVSSAPGELRVVDGAGLIHRFEEAAGRFVYEDRSRVPSFNVTDACVSDGSVILHIPTHVVDADQLESLHDEVLFRLDPSGALAGRFAVPYRYTRPWIVGAQMNRGMVACAGDDTVLLGLASMNRLDAYGVSDGGMRWHAAFEGVRVPPTLERLLPDGRTGTRVDVRDEGTFHGLLTVGGARSTPVAVQYMALRGEDVTAGTSRPAIETFLVDPETGEGVYLGEHLPRILSLDEEWVVFLEEEPYPQIEVARLGPGGDGT